MNIADILTSKLWPKILGISKGMISQPVRLLDLVKKGVVKFAKSPKDTFNEIKEEFNTAVRLVRAYANGDYRKIPVASIIMLVAAIVYFVWPVDLIPDFLPGGLIDDFMVLSFVFGALASDLDDFRKWEKGQKASKARSKSESKEKKSKPAPTSKQKPATTKKSKPAPEAKASPTVKKGKPAPASKTPTTVKKSKSAPASKTTSTVKKAKPAPKKRSSRL